MNSYSKLYTYEYSLGLYVCIAKYQPLKKNYDDEKMRDSLRA
jgi:hypothetical protein